MIKELAKILSDHNVSINCEIHDEIEIQIFRVEANENSSNYCSFMCQGNDFLINWIDFFLKPAIAQIEEKRKTVV